MTISERKYEWIDEGASHTRCIDGVFYACVANEGSGRWRVFIGFRENDLSLVDLTGFATKESAQKNCEQRLALLRLATDGSIIGEV